MDEQAIKLREIVREKERVFKSKEEEFRRAQEELRGYESRCQHQFGETVYDFLFELLDILARGSPRDDGS